MAEDEKVETTEKKQEVTPGTVYTAEQLEAMRANDKEALARLKKQAEKAKADLDALKAAQEEAAKAAERAKMDNEQRLQAEKADLETTIKQLTERQEKAEIDNAVKLAAIKAGVRIEADEFLPLVNREAIARGEDGKLLGVAEAIDALKEKYPFLFGEGPTGELPGTAGPAKGAKHRALTVAEQAENIRKSRPSQGFIGG